MSENTALGVAMAAGAAKGVDVWSLSSDHLPHVASEKYEPQINLDGERTEKYFLQVCRTDRTMRETTDVVVFSWFGLWCRSGLRQNTAGF